MKYRYLIIFLSILSLAGCRGKNTVACEGCYAIINTNIINVDNGKVDTEMSLLSRPDLDRSVLIPPDDIAQTVLYMLQLSDSSWVDEIYIRRRAAKPF